MRTVTALVLALAVTAPLSAQTRRPAPAPPRRPAPPLPPVRLSIRPFVVATEQQFAAKNTFDAIFGQALQPFWGGGVQVVFRDYFVELGASRFRKTGERAFRTNNQNFGLGIPLTASITPFEVSGGYRVRFRRVRWLLPYVGAGVGTYAYEEESTFSDTNENVKTRHSGYLVAGGAEIRLHKWVGVALDAQFTSIAGIIGEGGISKEANERDLGGSAVRIKLIVGR